MKCPFCGSSENGVLDSRETEEGSAIRRRRHCSACTRRFTTYERAEDLSFAVIKKDGARAPYNREKLVAGMRLACLKRPVSAQTLDDIATRIERQAQEFGEREVRTQWLGEQVMAELRRIDEVAYVRFASVYRSFRDASEFERELLMLKPKEAPAASDAAGPPEP